MKAVVTGGGGFVGGAICRRLQSLGHDVPALGRRPNPELAAAGIRTARFPAKPETRSCNFCDSRLFCPHSATRRA